MKKLSLVLAMVFVLSLSLISQAAYVDGTYEAWSDASDKSIQSAKVFIENGKIAGVILREYTDKHVEKTLDLSLAAGWRSCTYAERANGRRPIS